MAENNTTQIIEKYHDHLNSRVKEASTTNVIKQMSTMENLNKIFGNLKTSAPPATSVGGDMPTSSGY